MSTAAANPNPRPSHPIASVDNALTLLAMVGQQDSIRISEASRALGVVPSTASRLMAMLQYHDLVVHDPETRAYRAGPALMRIGLNVVERMDVRRIVRPFLERLAQELDETIHFLVLDGTSVMFVDGVESRRAVRTTRRNGEVRPAHCTSGGKAMLATLSRDELHRRYPDDRVSPCTPRSVTSRGQLERELAAVDRRGYATSVQESEPDIAALGAAIKSPSGALIGAFSVSLPMTRYSRATFAAMVDPLLATARDASEQLAFAELLEAKRG
ncbi:IclR family transcriptional regulator [Conexibacter stalactiti]|uniref:IclR family transcriptional regulator n=1 Tax=Conexibacter stalactiti TaxID=1940611 RepID=A0ABU4HJD4_9ACTN|nr:IclR family transcriptional regulator [Conexibacter stalactiti]MDW5593433.1 IclR family transcriptional regulator [Conexibacter stalactiti]MEC5034074.1 IclR family transcriptional regulator [Conexibacter stalactiti]